MGAGPVGLALALGLARAGRSVLVLEQEASTAAHSRAPAIWPRTQEILAGLGVIGEFLSRGTAVPRIALHDADADRILLSLPLEELAEATPYPWLLVLPQSETERLLLRAVRRESAARVLFSARVVGVDQDDSGVTVRVRTGGRIQAARASFAVGCDGAHSTVREAIGASFDGRTYRTRAALADLRLPDDRGLPFPRLTTRGGLALAIRIDEALWRLVIPFADDEGLTLEKRVERAAAGLLSPVLSASAGVHAPERRGERGDPTEGEEDAYEVVWQSEFRLHRRMSSRFVEGRIALAGDAAHLNSPVGGQGMNAGLHDAAVLTESLLRSLDDGSARALLRYERLRREDVGGGVNVFTDRLTRALLFARGRMVRPVLQLADLALRLPPVRRRFLRGLAMLDRGDGG